MNERYDRTLFSLLHDVARLIRVEADKRARVHGMTRAGWSLMGSLARRPGMSQKELADLMDVEPISVARMVDRLEANGMLERRADAGDRRIWRLHLLPAAEPILKKMAVVAGDLGEFVTQGVTPSVRDAMVEGLMRMKTNLTQKTESKLPDGTGPDGSGPDGSSPDGSAETGSVREVA